MAERAFRLIEGGRAADAPDALEAMYTKYGGSVFARCLFLLKERSAAEDAVQEVFAKALDQWKTFRAESSPLTYLLVITTHHCLNQLRSAQAPWRKAFARGEQAKPALVDGQSQLEARDLVRRLLSRVDAETGAAAIHYHLDGMTLEEVAAALGRSVPTVRARLERFSALGRKEGDIEWA